MATFPQISTGARHRHEVQLRRIFGGLAAATRTRQPLIGLDVWMDFLRATGLLGIDVSDREVPAFPLRTGGPLLVSHGLTFR